ncbi:MAG: prolipoprotein diacylglyceryl transferase [Candidatus Omnitrophica bacterium]|nr:prolipoprotein diacylglyceryl transferase [Candidatus Omnitrophota bacterium]MDD5653048.1 prolipoprotein diacylglyceryl transferase [Candidatus Omnitrophota bacterium]
MYPEICRIGPIAIYSYGLMLALAFIIGSGLAGLEARKQKMNPDIILSLCFIGLIFGVIGARIFYVLENIRFYLQYPKEIIILQHGGLSWFGGLILGFLACLFYIRKKKLPVYKVLDLLAPFIALGQAFGRVGCFLNGCCFGKTVIPIQLISSALLLVIFLILRAIQDRRHKEGTVFFSYLLLYSIKRFFVEFWRTDNPLFFHGLTLFQVLSIGLFLAASIKLLLLRGKKP